MIAYIEGKLVHREPTFVIIDVGGVGYHIRVSLNTFSSIGEAGKCKLHTYFHVREDAHTLYGFFDYAEKTLFLDLISVSGIGANTALVILSSLNTTEIQQAIVSENVRVIQSIKGIGTKTAQRIILELKDKMKKESFELAAFASADLQDQRRSVHLLKNEAILALTALGIAKNVAEKNVETILKTQGNDLKLEDLIKFALKI